MHVFKFFAFIRAMKKSNVTKNVYFGGDNNYYNNLKYHYFHK